MTDSKLKRWGLQPDDDHIPQLLKDNYPWVAFEAPIAPSGKVAKVPVCPRTGRRASTTRPEDWGTYAEAVQRDRDGTDRGECSGVGIVLTGADLDVGDLDRQLGQGDGNVTALATAAIERAYGGKVDTYAELSPSGRGIRVISLREGERVASFSNTAEGIDLYTGDGGRFVTITGHVINDAPIAHVSLEGIQRHRPSKSVEAPSVPMPDMLESAEIPLSAAASLPPSLHHWLLTGEHVGAADGNGSALAVASGLYRAGLTDAEVLTVLAGSVGGEIVAGAPHRRPGDPQGQADWLWRYTCLKARLHSPDRATEAFPVLDAAPGGGMDDDALESDTGRQEAGTSGRYKFLGMDDLQSSLKPPEWLVKPVLERETLGVLFGATGSRKSFVALDLMAAIATGKTWHGRHTVKGIAIYVCGEGTPGVAKRIEAWRRTHKDTAGALYVSKHAADISTPEGIKNLALGIAECYQRAQRDHGPLPLQIITIDTLSQNAGGVDENSNSDIALILSNLARIRDTYHCTVLVIHHIGHSVTNRERGAYAIRANVDFSIQCALTGDDDTRPLSRGTVLTPTKTKDGEAWQPVTLNAEQYVFLDHVDSEGDPMTTLTLYEPTQAVLNAAEQQQQAELEGRVIDYVESHQGCSKGEAEKGSGLTRDKARIVVNRLIDSGVIETRSATTDRGGQRVQLWTDSTTAPVSIEDLL